MIILLSLSIFSAGCRRAPADDAAPTVLYKVGVSFSTDVSYNDIIMDGFSDAITDKLPDASVTYTTKYITESKSGFDIAEGYVLDTSDVILAVGRDALIGAVSTTDELPIVCTDVTDIKGAINSVSTSYLPISGRNVTGISCMPDIADQLALAIEVTPHIKTLAIVYGSDDRESISQIMQIRGYMAEAGIQSSVYQFNRLKASRIKRICKKCDAIYIPAKSSLSTGAKKIASIATDCGIPTIAGDVVAGQDTLVCLSPDYYQIGYRAGLQAASILGSNKSPGRIDIENAPDGGTKYYNPTLANKLDLTFPKSFVEFDL